MHKLKLIWKDFKGLWRVCGPHLAVSWLLAIALNCRSVFRECNLQAADRFLGKGPFSVHFRACKTRFKVWGDSAVSGIREIYVRNIYLPNKLMQIRDGDIVVDLGANIGNFTNLALAHGSHVRVIAIEPNEKLAAIFEQSVGQNPGHRERVQLIRAVLGSAGTFTAPLKTEAEVIEAAGVDRIDFLKCDIEGGEFNLLHPASKLLAMADLLAIEIHAFAGDVEGFVQMLSCAGFQIHKRTGAPDGSCVVLAARA